jgi:hypothetical protein
MFIAMKKKVLFFTKRPPADPHAIHIWLGKTTLSHEQHLCEILGRYLGAAPTHLAISSTGKPYLPNSPLHFNLSDSGDWLALALSWEAPVGIDIEKLRAVEEMDEIVADHFSLKERMYVYPAKPIDERRRIRRFWEIWNRKEACVKALGLGLQDGMNRWDCSGKDWIFVNGVWVRSMPIKHHLSVAVAVKELL